MVTVWVEILLILNKRLKSCAAAGIRIQDTCAEPGCIECSNHTSKVGSVTVRAFFMPWDGASFPGSNPSDGKICMRLFKCSVISAYIDGTYWIFINFPFYVGNSNFHLHMRVKFT